METKIIDRLYETGNIEFHEFEKLITTTDKEVMAYLAQTARTVADQVYGREVYIRGLIEFTNFCKNNCLYCGIRRENRKAERYRLTLRELIECCETGYELGFRTFVLQGGEDAYFDDYKICKIISNIKDKYPDCAVTLSIGEKSKESYKAYFNAGADRYLLRHETADGYHYGMIHPIEMSFDNRKRCLYNLKEIGYQTGCGFMVGSPGQTVESLYKDICFIKEFKPHMAGVGPFIPHKDTPFADQKAGDLDMTLKLLSIIRLMHPHILLPATTALGTINPNGRELGIMHGANVVMPNLSPVSVRKKYMLYDNKISTGDEAAECKAGLEKSIENIGYRLAVARGDYKGENNV